MGEERMNTNEISFDWLLPLEDEEQFVGGLKKDLNEDNPIGGTGLNYETGDFEEDGENND